MLTFFLFLRIQYISGGAAHAGIKAGIHVELSGGISFFPPPAVETTVLKSDVRRSIVGKFMRGLQCIPVLALYTHRRVGRMRKRKGRSLIRGLRKEEGKKEGGFSQTHQGRRGRLRKGRGS